jgi:hypothetical protein
MIKEEVHFYDTTYFRNLGLEYADIYPPRTSCYPRNLYRLSAGTSADLNLNL